MLQDAATLHQEFNRLKDLANRGIWTPAPPGLLQLRLITLDSPDQVPFQPLVGFASHLQKVTGQTFTLVAGGYGCFDLTFVAEPGASDLQNASGAVADAITGDRETQENLNKLRTHIVRTDTPEATHTYRGYDDLELGLATSRESFAAARGDVRHRFGPNAGEATSFALVKVSISDLSTSQPADGLLKRSWRAAKAVLGRHRTHDIIVHDDKPYSNDGFREAVRPKVGNGAVVIVHGYANTFDQAFDAWVLGIHRIRLHHLGFFPILFSWPSHGSPARYLDDMEDAENSEEPLRETLDLISDASSARRPSVVAHSHGNKLLVRSLTGKFKGRPDKLGTLERIVLIEPDMGRAFLEQRVPLVTEAAERIVVYHSANDRALAVSEFLFKSVRAGRAGIRPEQLDELVSAKLEILDATAVSAGWTQHAPHIESAEVISDLYYLFQGQPPDRRHDLRPVSAGRWSIVSPLAR